MKKLKIALLDNINTIVNHGSVPLSQNQQELPSILNDNWPYNCKRL